MGYRNFFRLNMPYGMVKTETGWYLFNRFYKPLGWRSTETVEDVKGESYREFFQLFTNDFQGMTNKKLESIFKNGERVDKDEKGNISQIWFYNDGSNPVNNPTHWPRYFDIIRKLSEFTVK